MKRILVTGGGGFIGSHVVRQLVGDGHEVAIYDSFVQYVYPPTTEALSNIAQRFKTIGENVRVFRSSLEHYDYLLGATADFNPRVIIHLASMPLANMAREHPEEAVRSTVNATLNVLQAARKLKGFERLVYVSSSMVYGDFRTCPVRETHPTEPKEIYGSLKLACECLVRGFGTHHGIEFSIVRPSAVYGPTDNNRRVIALFLENALAGRPLIVNGPQRALDFTYVSDAAHGVVLAALHPGAPGQIFNVTRGEGRTLGEAAQIVAKEVPGTRVELRDPEAWMPERGQLDISHAREVLGYDPRVSLEDGISRYVDYLRRQREDLTHSGSVVVEGKENR